MTYSEKKIVYLAVPYSDRDREVRVQRFEAVNKAAAKLMKDGEFVFSPISHTHPIAEAGDLPKGWEFWQNYDRSFLDVAKKVIVLKIPGWDKSVGVKGEIDIAAELDIPVEYMEVKNETA